MDLFYCKDFTSSPYNVISYFCNIIYVTIKFSLVKEWFVTDKFKVELF